MRLIRISIVAFLIALVLTMAWPDSASAAVADCELRVDPVISTNTPTMMSVNSIALTLACKTLTSGDVVVASVFVDLNCRELGLGIALPTLIGFHEPVVIGFETSCLSSFRGDRRATPLLDNILLLPDTPQHIPLLTFAVPPGFPRSSVLAVALTTPNATRDEILRSVTGELVPPVANVTILQCDFDPTRNPGLTCLRPGTPE